MTEQQRQEQTEKRHELYVHRRGEPRVTLVSVETTTTVKAELEVGDAEFVWLEDSETEVDVSMTIAAAGLPHRGHVHVNRCRTIQTTVTYNGVTKERGFHPSTQIKRVYEWAISTDGFGLTPTDAAEHELQVTGTSIKPDESDHVGSFANDDCTVAFSLVAKIRNEG